MSLTASDVADLTSALKTEAIPVYKGGYVLKRECAPIARVLHRHGVEVRVDDRNGRITVTDS